MLMGGEGGEGWEGSCCKGLFGLEGSRPLLPFRLSVRTTRLKKKKKKGISSEETSKRRVRMNTCFSYGGQPSKNKSILQFQHMLLMPWIAKEHKWYENHVRPTIVSSNVAAYLKPSCVPSVHALFAARLCARVCVPMHADTLLLKENWTWNTNSDVPATGAPLKWQRSRSFEVILALLKHLKKNMVTLYRLYYPC